MALQPARLRQTQPPAQTTQPRAWTPAAFRVRCLELMRGHDAGWWSCRPVAHEVSPGTGELAWIAVSVPSATRLDAAYTVRYDAATDLARCSCVAATHGQPCFHAGVAREYGVGAVKSHQEARRVASRQAAWEGNEAALGPSL